MLRNAESLTLDDLRDLLSVHENAYQGLPPGLEADLSGSLPVIMQFLQTVMGQLYMFRLVTEPDLRRIAADAVAFYSQWSRVSFSIGLEHGLGNLTAGDVQAYLSAFNRPYRDFLLGYLYMLSDRGKLDAASAAHVGTELTRFIESASTLLADLGRASASSLRPRHAASPSPVAAFLRDIAFPSPFERLPSLSEDSNCECVPAAALALCGACLTSISSIGW